MARPRSLEALQRASSRYARRRTLAIAGALAVFVGSIVGAAVLPESQAGLAALVGLFAFTVLFSNSVDAWVDGIPGGFSVAEKVKYRMDRCAKFCSEFNHVLEDVEERRRVGRRCRRQAAALVSILRPYGRERRPGEATTFPDLFTGELSAFAGRSIELVRLVGGLVRDRKSIPEGTVRGLIDIASGIEAEPRRVARQEPALDSAIAAAKAANAVPDETLGAGIGRRAALWTKAKVTSLTPVSRFSLIAFVISIAFLVSLIAVEPVKSEFSPGEKLIAFLTYLAVIATIWARLRE